MKSIKEIPVDEIKKYFRYEKETGNIYRTVDQRTNKVLREPKLILDHITYRGYKSLFFRGKNYLQHRIAYAITNNKSYFGIIDHIDGNKLNNRIDNLQVTTNSFNVFKQFKENKGVSQMRNGQWEAYITIKNKRYGLGIFDTKKEALASRYGAEILYIKSLSSMESKSGMSFSSKSPSSS